MDEIVRSGTDRLAEVRARDRAGTGPGQGRDRAGTGPGQGGDRGGTGPGQARARPETDPEFTRGQKRNQELGIANVHLGNPNSEFPSRSRRFVSINRALSSSHATGWGRHSKLVLQFDLQSSRIGQIHPGPLDAPKLIRPRPTGNPQRGFRCTGFERAIVFENETPRLS